MPIRVRRTSEPGFRDEFDALLNQLSLEEGLQASGARIDESPEQIVRRIIADVRRRGDRALIELTEQLDGCRLTPETLRVSEQEIDEACERCDSALMDALELAAERIRRYQESILAPDPEPLQAGGRMTGVRYTAVDAAGLCVPGAAASLASSVLMNAVPAKVAGVPRLAITVPTPEGRANPLVLLAARLAGVDEIYRVGGAQAVAALAYGTESIAAVDKITGPGNAYVAAAKRRVFGRVGIDMIAGPSEILVIADADNDPEWIALDMLSQAEHDESAQAILITDDRAMARAVEAAIARNLETLQRREIAGASWRDFGAIITVPDLDRAAVLADRIAPEHLELCVADPEALADRITHAGAIFLGAWTPEAIGDYVGGPNHVLPTARSARFSSGLSVLDFLKRTTLARMTPAALRAVGPSAETLALSESLEAHALSVTARLNHLNE
jgi:histidinol dehydrogenase